MIVLLAYCSTQPHRSIEKEESRAAPSLLPVCAALQEQPDANGYQEFSIRHIPTAASLLYLRPRPLTAWAGRLYSGTYNEIVREMENK